MSRARDDTDRLTILFLPAMLCNDELYRQQIEALRDLVDPMVVTVAEASMAESATVVLQQAPPHFLVGTSYGFTRTIPVFFMRCPR